MNVPVRGMQRTQARHNETQLRVLLVPSLCPHPLARSLLHPAVLIAELDDVLSIANGVRCKKEILKFRLPLFRVFF